MEADWNANRVPKAVLAKVRRSIERYGVVENLVARPHPSEDGRFEVLSGNHRLRVLRELGHRAAPVVVVELDDAAARLLAQTLNRTRGTDDPRAYARLLEEVLTRFSPAEAAGFLPETEASIDRVLRDYRPAAETEEALVPPARPRSKLGEIYEHGAHRVGCGDATDPDFVAELLGGVRPRVMATDPPYGVKLDHGWRDGVRQPHGSARSGQLANDDRADWAEAYRLGNAEVAYVWHGALSAHVARAGLIDAGFEIRQQVVWVKQVHVLSRGQYQWQHECCWYAVRKGCKAGWQGGRKQTTVWQAASPIMPFGAGAESEDSVTRHPTQKPLELFERPLLNHTKPGDVVYDPFGGSGTCLIAAERHGRRCVTIELDPAWCDLIRARYEQFPKEGR